MDMNAIMAANGKAFTDPQQWVEAEVNDGMSKDEQQLLEHSKHLYYIETLSATLSRVSKCKVVLDLCGYNSSLQYYWYLNLASNG